jgi:hypothetical protein
MPQFELIEEGRTGRRARVRARSLEDAARSFFRIRDDLELRLEALDDLSGLGGWMYVYVDEHRYGRIRNHDRMRFRRD